MKQEGIILKGDKNILQKIQATSENIPKIEAIRILFQNLVVWLKLAETTIPKREIDSFLILRNYLNIGESYLTFFGYLKPSYRERMEEFKKKVQEFGVEKELAEKIVLGYLTKVSPEEASQECEKYQSSLTQAKKDCLEATNNLLSIYLKNSASLVEKLDLLGRKIRPKHLFNLVFFNFLRDLKEIKPKFLPIVFRFKITDLWKMAVYSEIEKEEELFEILKRYFKVQKFSDEILIKIFEAHPSFSTVEIT